MSGLHVGIIMDGNGRWARAQGRPRWRGHLAGVDSVRDVVRGAPEIGITTLTLYAFSSDNWKRPPGEVGRLFWLLREYCQRERNELVESGVRVTHVGRRDRIPQSALAELDRTLKATARGHRLHLQLAIDYGSRWALTEAARAISRHVASGDLRPEEISLDLLDRAVAGEVPNPDLIVRTAGEQRLSDFLLWESAYAELYFTDALWPDFRREDLALAVSEFQRRERRFGAVTAPAEAPQPTVVG
ncbi:MAG: polyprenyl diphosphate synthase [Gemmatimonadota bacterium]|nr:polyprenyl diphosphate synthase [Gemmatimonadota bacterium]MDH3368421.1 polyprenyl diphosphate synthase [Gemmatimonadota bacterium]MDH3477693.1 polyprenyl diphosphate synthase [Gemmatimonadota bacterium]MDH3569901.1 polyprenyl diphosphate synthase [Gemmatimonadota bacterium]MDH5548791.1 polyprenyl diphosphate synthase [Gemmatimonadota bacterium]